MNIAVMPGDGIGKEVTAEAVKVLQALAGSDAKFTEAPIGAAGVAAAGVPLPTPSCSARSALPATRADRATSVPGSAC